MCDLPYQLVQDFFHQHLSLFSPFSAPMPWSKDFFQVDPLLGAGDEAPIFCQGGGLMGSCPIQLLSKLGIGNQRNHKANAANVSSRWDDENVLSTIRWYSCSLALGHVAVSPPQFGHFWIEPTLCHQESKFPRAQPPSILFFSKIMSCFCRVDLPNLQHSQQ